MNKGVQKVRKSIKQRKKIRERKETESKRMLPYVASDEEKHGFERPLDDLNGPTNEKKDQSLLRSMTFIKAIVSIVLFFGTSFLLQANAPALQKSQKLAYNVLEKEFPFAKVNDWYQTTFGTPLSITPEGNVNVEPAEHERLLPVTGDVVETFSTNGSGIMISPMDKSVVSAMDRGVVIFAGNDNETKKTVIIQHADNSETTYGFLSSIDVHPYQIVHANETVATFQPTAQNEHVYFSIEKDNQFIDPTKVIPVDDIP